MRVTLHVIAGPQTGRDFTFDQHDTFMIGRSEDAQFCLPQDRFFSRHHCILEIAPPQCFLRDLGSTNGTFVNGIRVESAHLKHGDRIQGGETVLEVEVAADTADMFSIGPRSTERTEPSIITVACLNCGVPAQAEASRPDAKLSYVCDECREKLKKNPQPIPNYQMLRVLGQRDARSLGQGRSGGRHKNAPP
jgi:serine/threonine-protein kinase